MRFVLLAVCAVLVALGVALGGAGAAPAPSTKVCQKGGWARLVDDAGNPFAGQTACTTYVRAGGTVIRCTVMGTSGNDVWASAFSTGVICGLGGNDTATVEGSARLYGGTGDDFVTVYADGFFHGGEGFDTVSPCGGTYTAIEDDMPCP